MTGPIKKARKERELDELAFNVLSSFRHQGAMQWTDWYETTSARRGERGLGTTTFNDAVKRLMAEGRVQVDGDGCYRVAYDAVEDLEDVVNIADTADFTADFPLPGMKALQERFQESGTAKGTLLTSLCSSY